MRRLPVLALVAGLALCIAQAGVSDGVASGSRRTASCDDTCGFNPADTSWHPDILDGYEARYVDQGEAFDGPSRSTIVRKIAKEPSKKGYLYIHGFNDYFFQSEMGERFVDSGYHFYAVDLRRYGRSLLPWQWPCNVRDMKEYFADIDSAVAQMKRDGIKDITLSGHSTGGLTVTLYTIDRGARVPVDRVVTDSPFYDWNFSPFMRKMAIPVAGFFGRIFKNTKISQGNCDGYSYSLLKNHHGEWTYDTVWKKIHSPDVTLSWINAIDRGHAELVRKGHWLTVPLLVMHSSRRIEGCSWTPEFQTGDAVLDPEMIGKQALKIGRERQIAVIDSGLHDLILSREDVRNAAYDTIFQFIRTH